MIEPQTSAVEPVGPHGRREEAFCLGPWTVRPSLNRLEQGQNEIRLGPKVMDLLLLLAAKPGAVVAKDAIIDQLWDGGQVTDEVITTTVYALRRALGDNARQSCFVATVRGRGYRLIEAPTPSDRSTVPVRRERKARRLVLTPWWVAAGFVLALGSGWVTAWWSVDSDAQAQEDRSAVASPRLDAETAEALALGRHFFRQGTLEDLEKARRHFSVAVARSPGHAPAHMALADAWLEAAPDLPPPAQEAAFRQAAVSAQRALMADRELPDAHRALGWISLQHTRDPVDAARRFSRFDSAERGGERHLARYLSASGRHAEARTVMARHVSDQPASKSARLALAQVLYRGRHLSEALRELDRARELDAADPEVARLRTDVLAALGHHSDALQACLRDLALSGEPAATSSELSSVFGRAGFAGAQRFLFERIAVSEPRPDPVRLARLSSRFGASDTALGWLDQAFEEGRADLVWLAADPAYDPVRSLPRFRNLLERLGLGKQPPAPILR